MTKIQTNIFGKSETLKQTEAHFISEALDEFLIAEYPDTVLGSLIKLSIGLEIYIKTVLAGIDPSLIHAKKSHETWKKLKIKFSGMDRRKRKKLAVSEFQKVGVMSDGKTITFGLAIEMLVELKHLPKRVRADMVNLVDYRNGLFHWEANHANAFMLAKQSLRLFQWILKDIEKTVGHYLGGQLNVIDPMNEKRKQLRELSSFKSNELTFNVQRRMYKHRRDNNVYHQFQARLNGDVYNPKARTWNTCCPACGYNRMVIFESGSNSKAFLQCVRCDFCCSDAEFEARKADGQPNLMDIFRAAPKPNH
jgi:hypothetical protein